MRMKCINYVIGSHLGTQTRCPSGCLETIVEVEHEVE